MVIFQFLLDLIFPKFCVGCSKEGDWICDECRGKILLVKTQVCPKCGRISELGRYCRKDHRPWGAAGIIVACYYQEGPIKEIIHNFKYNNITELKNFLGDLMAKAFKDNNIGKDVIVSAVPLHFWRRAQRGYNQSELLAERVVKIFTENQPKAGPPLAENFKIIKKIRKTKPQVKFSGKKRRENLKKCYKIVNKNIVRGKTIVLVDDVTTTGTTLNECAKVLRKAGARKVWGLVIAKG